MNASSTEVVVEIRLKRIVESDGSQAISIEYVRNFGEQGTTLEVAKAMALLSQFVASTLARYENFRTELIPSTMTENAPKPPAPLREPETMFQ